MQDFSSENMKEYLSQEALLFPVETIVEKANANDYKFFLTQKNFLKVADTLERFEKDILDGDSADAKSFVLFKRRLYQMYEVQHRSIEEHELYSFNIERKNLAHSYQANLVHIENEVATKQQEQSTEFAVLQDKIFKSRTLNPKRFYGLLSGVGALYGW